MWNIAPPAVQSPENDNVQGKRLPRTACGKIQRKKDILGADGPEP
jgi:hypothetical protein